MQASCSESRRGEKRAAGRVFTSPSSQCRIRRALTIRPAYTNMCSYDGRLRPCPPLRPDRRLRGAAGAAAGAGRAGARAGREADGRRGLGSGGGPRGACRDAARRGALALSRSWPWCPPIPARAAELWEGALRRLEGIGAEVESERAGEAFFRADGLRGIHGDLRGPWPRPGGRWRCRRGSRRRRPASPPTRRRRRAGATGAGARRVARREPVVSAEGLRRFLSPLPVAILRRRLGARRAAARDLVEALERLGVGDARARWPSCRPTRSPTASARSGCGRGDSPAGEDEPLRPRERHEELVEALELPEAAAGQQLERALGAAGRQAARLAAAAGRGRCGAAPRGAAGRRRQLERARWRCGGRAPRRRCCGWCWRRSWPSCPGRRRRCACGRRRWGRRRRPARAARGGRAGAAAPAALAEAVRQVRAAAGAGALLRVLEVDADSRVPERWTMLTPFPELDEPGGRSASTPAAGAGPRRRGRRPGRGRRRRGRGGPRGVAGRGPLVDAAAAAPPLLRAGRWPTAATSVVFRSRRRWYVQRA